MNDPKKMLQEANGFLRNAQNNMFGGKNELAVDLLNKADELALQLKNLMPDDFQTTSLLQKIDKMRKDLERKGVKTHPGGTNEYPFEVQAQLNRIRESLLRKDPDNAKREIDNYYARFAGPMTQIAEIRELNDQYIKLEQERAMQQAKNAEAQKLKDAENARHEALCSEWENKLKSIPYFAGTAQNVPQLLTEKETFKLATITFNEYQQSLGDLPKSFMLESIERDLKQRIDQFPASIQEAVAHLTELVVEMVQQRTDLLNRDTAWQSDNTVLPNYIGKGDFDRISERVEELRPLFADYPQGMESIHNALGTLHSINELRIDERSKRVVIKPAVMTGPEAGEAIDSASQALKKYYPEANIYDTSVIRAWENKRLEEWADSTKTQWIVKNLRETTVQISAEIEDGTCHLFTLHVERDIQPDGTFGHMKSHIMYDELMLKPSMA